MPTITCKQTANGQTRVEEVVISSLETDDEIRERISVLFAVPRDSLVVKARNGRPITSLSALAEGRVVLVNPVIAPRAAAKAKWTARKKSQKAELAAANASLTHDDSDVAAVTKSLEKSTIPDEENIPAPLPPKPISKPSRKISLLSFPPPPPYTPPVAEKISLDLSSVGEVKLDSAEDVAELTEEFHLLRRARTTSDGMTDVESKAYDSFGRKKLRAIIEENWKRDLYNLLNPNSEVDIRPRMAPTVLKDWQQKLYDKLDLEERNKLITTPNCAKNPLDIGIILLAHLALLSEYTSQGDEISKALYDTVETRRAKRSAKKINELTLPDVKTLIEKLLEEKKREEMEEIVEDAEENYEDDEFESEDYKDKDYGDDDYED